jgi:hypothetical protein
MKLAGVRADDSSDEISKDREGDEVGEEEAVQVYMAGCEQSAVLRSVACMHDAGRSLQSADLPGGAVCFAGNAAVWAALRALVQSAGAAPQC